MSQFDFPRIHFSGDSYINPPTANNNAFLPLVTYDPIDVRVMIPPRIYLNEDLKKSIEYGELFIPSESGIQEDSQGNSYFEIHSVNSPQKYKNWITAPLGNSELDKDYHKLYAAIKQERSGLPLKGIQPSFWNYYGGMDFGFENTFVQAVCTQQESDPAQTYSISSTNTPEDIAQFLGKEVHMRNKHGESSAVMVDVLPSLAFYSQVFCDSLHIEGEQEALMTGKPCKASLRFSNQQRVTNLKGVLASSGSFFCTIAIEDLNKGSKSAVIKFFIDQGHHPEDLLGVYVRYNLSEVKEDQMPDYSSRKPLINPARAKVIGTLSPWLKGDLKSISMGRQLAPVEPFKHNLVLASFPSRLDISKGILTMDFLGSIPKIKDLESGLYKTYKLGKLAACIEQEDKTRIELGEITVNEEELSAKKIASCGGLVDLHINPEIKAQLSQTEQGNLILVHEFPENEPRILMRELEYMVASDQAGLYAEEGANPEEGYRTYSESKEPCIVRVYKHGKPHIGPVKMSVMEIRITSPGATSKVSEFLRTSEFRDQTKLQLPVDEACNAMYVFYTNPPLVMSKHLVPEIFRTGSFVSLRVLPKRDYSKFLDPDHPEYTNQLSFDFVKKEMLEVYELIFPYSAEITPFIESYFLKGASFLLDRMSDKRWDSYTYMPTSRDMPAGVKVLYKKWLEINQ